MNGFASVMVIAGLLGAAAGTTPAFAQGTPSPAQGAAQQLTFDQWRTAFRSRAAEQGISEATLKRVLPMLDPLPRVVELDRQQPEFSRTFWDYMDRAVSTSRIDTGRKMMVQHRALLDRLTRTYGVPGRFIVAFWGLETNYGAVLGGFSVPSALATLAHDGRRGAFFEAELMAALRIVDQGKAAPEQMVGSWAGAMGQTQFMPSTFIRHAMDGNGDGAIDPWKSVEDALTSAANYLKNIGWDEGYTWGREVRLPKAPSADLLADTAAHPLPYWQGKGLRTASGGQLPSADIPARLLLPGGVERPAFLVYDNFDVILTWNRADLYGLAVGVLADRLAGRAGIQAARVAETPMSFQQVRTLQADLETLGYDPGGVDGIAGSGTRRAVRRFQMDAGLTPDGYPDAEVLQALNKRMQDRSEPAQTGEGGTADQPTTTETAPVIVAPAGADG